MTKYYFESEIVEGFKKNICFICQKPNCKHLQEWRIISGIEIIPKKRGIFRSYFKKKKPLVEPQWKKLLKSKQKSMEEKEFLKSILIPYESKPEMIIQLPFKYKHRLKGWKPLGSQGI